MPHTDRVILKQRSFSANCRICQLNCLNFYPRNVWYLSHNCHCDQDTVHLELNLPTHCFIFVVWVLLKVIYVVENRQHQHQHHHQLFWKCALLSRPRWYKSLVHNKTILPRPKSKGKLSKNVYTYTSSPPVPASSLIIVSFGSSVVMGLRWS